MNHLVKAALIVLALVLSACGGLDRTSISAGRLMYGNTVQFTIEGPNLDKGITFVAPKCTNATELAGSTATQRIYSCTPNVVGPMTVAVVGGNVLLHSSSFDIPVPQVTVATTLGTFVVELYPANAPVTVNNFLQYVNADFYKNLIFHRVIANFMIQGGGFDASILAPTTRDPIKLEIGNGLSNVRGTVAMARTSALDSATAQFFVNTVDNVKLDTDGGGYAVFGKVISGMEAVDAISATPTLSIGLFENLPVTAVIINAITQTQ